jgi:hypothetical protein
LGDLVGIVTGLSGAPMPTLLILGGLAFLALSVIGKLGTIIVVAPNRQTLAAVLGATLLVLGITVETLRPDASDGRPPTERTPASPLILTAEFLTGRNWEFRHREGDVIALRVRLTEDGRIDGIGHPNEDRWRLEAGQLVFLHRDGRASTRFTETERANGKVVLSGRLLLTPPDEVVIHVLAER